MPRCASSPEKTADSPPIYGRLDQYLQFYKALLPLQMNFGHCLPIVLSVARQKNRRRYITTGSVSCDRDDKTSIFMLNRIKQHLSVMFAFYNIADDRHSEPCPLPDRFSRKKRVEQSLLDFRTHTFSIITDGKHDSFIQLFQTHRYLRRISFGSILPFSPYRIAGVVHHIQHCPAEILRNQPDRRNVFGIVFMNGNIKILVVGTHCMISQPHIFCICEGINSSSLPLE